MKRKKKAKPIPKGDGILSCVDCGGELWLVDGFVTCGKCDKRLGPTSPEHRRELKKHDRLIEVSKPKDWSFV